MLQRAEAEVRLLKPLLQRGRTTLVTAETTSNPTGDAELATSKSSPFLRGAMGLRGGGVVTMCRCSTSIYSDYGYGTDVYSPERPVVFVVLDILFAAIGAAKVENLVLHYARQLTAEEDLRWLPENATRRRSHCTEAAS